MYFLTLSELLATLRINLKYLYFFNFVRQLALGLNAFCFFFRSTITVCGDSLLWCFTRDLFNTLGDGNDE